MHWKWKFLLYITLVLSTGIWIDPLWGKDFNARSWQEGLDKKKGKSPDEYKFSDFDLHKIRNNWPPPREDEKPPEDVQLTFEMGFFFPKLDSRARFSQFDPRFNLQRELGLSDDLFLGWGRILLHYFSTTFFGEFLQGTIDGSSGSRDQDLTIDGTVFGAGEAIRTRQKIFRIGGGFYYNLLPKTLQGLKIKILMNMSYVRIGQKVNLEDGTRSEVSTVTAIVPKFGIGLDFHLIYASPTNIRELLFPHSYLSIFFRVMAVLRVEYKSRRIRHDYEIETGIRFTPAEFFAITLNYRNWDFHVLDTRENEEVDFSMEGINFSISFTF